MTTLVSTGQITIIDNNDGLSVYTATIYKTSTTQPSTPVGGSFNFKTAILTPPTGWEITIPTVTSTPVWACNYTFTTTDIEYSVVALTWTVPRIFAVTGTGRETKYIFSSSETAPMLPTNSSTTGWDTIANSNTVWMSYQINILDSFGTVTTYGAWQPPIRIKGEKGDNAGSGVNICHPWYSSFEQGILPPIVSANGTVVLDSGSAYFGTTSLKLTASAADNYCYFGASTNSYNVYITPGKKWILSAYVKATIANATAQFQLITSDTVHHSYTVLTSATANTWELLSVVIDLTANAAKSCVLRVDNDAGSGISMWFDGIMLEEQVGALSTPSSYSQPAGVGNTGTSVFRAYVVTTSASPPSTPGNTANGTPPGGYTSTPTVLTTGQFLYQTDGTMAAGTTTTIWSAPYLSNLKVGTLEAITANTGNLTVSGNLTAGNPVRSGTTMTSGAGALIEASGAFVLGTPETNIFYNGSGGITINGELITTNNIAAEAITYTFPYFVALNANITTTADAIIGTYTLSNVWGTGQVFIQSRAEIYDIAANTNPNLVKCRVEVLLNGSVWTTSAVDTVFIPGYGTLRNDTIGVLKTYAHLTSQIGDTIALRLRGNCDSAFKVIVSNFHNFLTLYKK